MKNIKQTGVLLKPPAPTDYIMGGKTGIAEVERIADGFWGDYLPTNEKQHNYSFDTMSCTTFSALNICEIQMNWLIRNNFLSLKQIEWLNKNGYMDNKGNINFSDRFTAIMSGTTKQGNYFTAVWDSIRKDGLLPDSDLPFDGNTWDEYHDKSKITDAMKEKAKKILDILTAQYEWVCYDEVPAFSEDQISACEKALKQAPIHIGIPVPASHAITLYGLRNNKVNLLDHYSPFIFEKSAIKAPIHFGLKGYVSIKKETTMQYTFTKTLKYGMTDPQVANLQRFLNTDDDTKVAVSGNGSAGKETNYFGILTQKAVVRFQKKYGLYADGIFGKNSSAKATEVQKKN